MLNKQDLMFIYQSLRESYPNPHGIGSFLREVYPELDDEEVREFCREVGGGSPMIGEFVGAGFCIGLVAAAQMRDEKQADKERASG